MVEESMSTTVRYATSQASTKDRPTKNKQPFRNSRQDQSCTYMSLPYFTTELLRLEGSIHLRRHRTKPARLQSSISLPVFGRSIWYELDRLSGHWVQYHTTYCLACFSCTPCLSLRVTDLYFLICGLKPVRSDSEAVSVLSLRFTDLIHIQRIKQAPGCKTSAIIH